MKLITFILIASVWVTVCLSQSNTGSIDSLRQLLQMNSTEDTNRVWLLVKITNSSFTSVPDDALKYANEALKISEKIKWQKGIALSYRCLGGVELVRSNYINALDHYQKALANDTKESKLFEAMVIGNVGIIYAQMKQYDKALESYKRHLAVSVELKNKETETMAVGNIGTIYQITKRYDSALYYYRISLAKAKEIDNKRIVSNVLCILGSLYKETGNYEDAVEYSENSVKIAEESGNLYVKAPALNNLAWAHLNLLKFDKAEAYNKQAIEVAKQLGNVGWQSESWEALYTNYERQKKFGQALEAYKTYILLRDSVLNDEKRQEITRKEMRFEAEKKEAVLNAGHQATLKKHKIVRNAIIMGVAIFLIAAVISFLFYKRRRDALEKQKEAELRSEVVITEMKALRAQMNPHFIFNSLNSISEYIANNNVHLADEYLTKFARLMRLILENSERKEVPLADDLNALEIYMDLESLRMNNKFSYEIKVDQSLDKENTLVPPLLLQPFVENSIWHGIGGKEGAGKILISVSKDGDMINCIVEDDGIGIRKEESAKTANVEGKKSLGVKITKERIAVLNKLKNSKAGVTFIELQQGTRVEVKLPLELNFLNPLYDKSSYYRG